MPRSRVPRKANPASPPGGGSDFFNPFPRYMQIRNILIRRLGDGFAPGDRFPTEHALCSEFGVSRETVREALLGLEDEGLIARHRGKGSVVLRLPNHTRDERLTGLVEDFTELHLDTEVDVLSAATEPVPPRIALALHLQRGAQLFRIVRVRRVDAKPFAFHDAFVPEPLGVRLSRLDLTHTTLFRELARMPSIKLTEIYLHIDAVAADVRMARLLDVEVGAPLLVTRRAVDHARTGTPTMFFETYFRADRYYYSVQVNEPSAAPQPPGSSRRRAGASRPTRKA